MPMSEAFNVIVAVRHIDSNSSALTDVVIAMIHINCTLNGYFTIQTAMVEMIN